MNVPGTRRFGKRRASGFTLLEVLAAMLLLALLLVGVYAEIGRAHV